MNSCLFNKHIIVGVTGGIAAYKSADLVRRLREAGAQVRVVMTENAKQFITPLTMQAASGYPVHDNLFDLTAEAAMGHIELARWADVILVAPATADFMARFLHGEGDDLLTTLCLATPAKIALAPAMNQGMWKNTFTQANVQALQAKNIYFFGPTEGSQACGDTGMGRMLEPLDLVTAVDTLFATQTLAGKHVLLTAGPTREAIDPVRYLTNGSSGKMGYALAQAAYEAGASVTLISGPVGLTRLPRVNHIDVISADDMLQAVMRHIESADIFLSVAAVADYCVANASPEKMPKIAELTLTLKRTPDIVATVAQLPKKPLVIGFAAETNDVLTKAQAKRMTKKLDMIIANQVGENLGMSTDDNAVTMLWEQGKKEFPRMSKQQLARLLIANIVEIFY